MAKKIKEKKILSPIIMTVILIFILSIASFILSLLNFDSTQTSVVNGSLETSIIVVRNIFSKEGITYLFSNFITNFNMGSPIILLILSLLATSVAKSSGLLKHLFKPLKKLKPFTLTLLVVFISMVSTLIGDYSYIILLPLAAVLYEYLGKNKAIGLLTVFLGITIGYGTGIFYNHMDFSLGVLTQSAAIINVDQAYRSNLYSNLYIMIFSTILVTYLLSLLISKYLNKYIKDNNENNDELVTSKKALIFSLFSSLIIIIPVIIGLIPKFGGILLDNSTTIFVAKIFNDVSPFNQSFMFILLLIISISSIVYGFISKNFKNAHDMNTSFNSEFSNVGYLFILLFLFTIVVSIIDWSNIGAVIINNIMSLLNVLEFTGIPLIVFTFILIIVMSILVPGTLEKWTLISPLLIPLFMRANISPDFTQFIFKTADAIGKIISPVFIFYIVMLGFLQKKENVSFFSPLKRYLPIVIVMAILWLLIIVIWYIAGLPVGIDSFPTM